MRHHKHADRGGYILILALVFAAILTTTMGALATSVSTFGSSERRAIASAQALNIAEAGIDKAVYQLNQNTGYTGETNTALGAGTFTVAVTSISGGAKRITVTASVPNSTSPIATRIVKADTSAGSSNISFHYGVQVGEGGFQMDGGSQINGSIYANGTIQATNGVTITGSATAANPAATSTDQANDTPVPISSCTASTCVTFADTSATQDFAQSFQTSVSGAMNSVELYMKKVGAPADATLRIVNDNGGVPGTDTIMTGTLLASLVSTSFGWVKVPLPSTPVLDPGQSYWLVIDGAVNASKYYVIGANTNYANGTAKTGQYAGTWNSTSPAGLDGYFRMYLGGGTSYIGGGAYVGSVQIGSSGSDNAWAHTVKGASVTGTIYCQTGSINNKSCTTSAGDPTPAAMPLSDSNIQDWKNDALAGGTQTGDVTVGWAGASMGPKKIVGNLTVNGGGTLTLTGTLWVTGTVTVTGGGKVKLDSSYGANDGALVSDGRVAIDGGANFAGSGTSGSYPFLITTSSCPADPGCSGNYAVTLNGGAGTVAIIAQSGTASISGGSSLKEVTARQVIMTGGAQLTYDSGLISANFSSGPGGSWQITKGSYAIVQ